MAYIAETKDKNYLTTEEMYGSLNKYVSTEQERRVSTLTSA